MILRMRNVDKITSNACFGKTMENLQNQKETFSLTKAKQAEKSLLKPTFKSYQIIHNSLVSVSFAPSKIICSKPTPVGVSILDLS